MKLDKDSLKLVKFYEKLGFSKEQSLVLWKFHYNDRSVMRAMRIYESTSLKLKWISFCKSVADFMELIDYWEDEIARYFWELYEFKLSLGSKFDNISKDELFKKFKEESKSNLKEEPKLDKERTINLSSSSYFFCWMPSRPIRKSSYNKRWYGNLKSKGGYDRLSYKGEICEEISLGDMIEGPSFDSELDDYFEATRYDKYQQIEEKWFLNVLSNPTSTIRTNCNTASMDIVRENVLEWHSISTSMVRAEELLNYFKFDLKGPKKGKKFWVNVKFGDKPNSDNKMLLVWIQWEKVAPTRQNIVALLDASGSMYGREIEMQLTIMTIISKLKKWDKFSLITYSGDDITVIDDITFDKNLVDEIIEKVLSIGISWCTNGSWALKQAYDLIASNKIEDGINRVIIMTDWDFNFWDCSIDKIKKLISAKKETWAYLSVVWTWTYNTNDELMETLAKNWNGNYCIVNNLWDVEENIYNKYNKLMFTIATDVKAQIEFNPKYVKSYRLIWYENRALTHDQFRDDNVIAEPFGCWNYAMALYEVEMNDAANPDLWLKYQKSQILDSDELCTLHIRYKNLWEKNAEEETTSVLYKDALVKEDTDIDMGYIIYVVAEKLRSSEFVKESDIKEAKALLKKLKSDKEYTINDDRIAILEELMKVGR